MAKRSPANRPPSASSGEDAQLPDQQHWQSPLAWKGSPPEPIEGCFQEFPEFATWVRAAVHLTIAESLGQGVTRQTFRSLPALLKLNRGKPLELHFTGVDGQCWTYRPVKHGRKTRWSGFTGEVFPGDQPREFAASHAANVERIEVQSLLPMYGSRQYVSFAIRDDGSAEQYAGQSDLDPRD